MNARTTAILLAVLLAVGAAWWFTRGATDAPPQMTTGDDKAVPVFPEGALNVEQVDRIEIAQPGRETVVLRRERGRWRMTEPARFDADAKTVTQLLQTLAALADQGGADASSVAADPLATLTLSGGDASHTVTLGPRIGGGAGTIRVNGGAPRLVADRLHGFFERYQPTDLLSKQLATPAAYATDAFTVTTPLSSVRVEQLDGRWLIDGDPAQPALGEPVPGYIDVEGYLNIPNATRIERFMPINAGSLASYGMDLPRVRVDYETATPTGEKQASSLLIGTPTDAERTGYYAAYLVGGDTRPVVFVLPAEFSVVMARSADEFRDPRLFTWSPEFVSRLTVEPQEGLGWSLNLTDEAGSIIAQHRSRSGDMAMLREHLTALVGATARGYGEFAAEADSWADPLRVTLYPMKLGMPQRVTFYRPTAEALRENETLRDYCLARRTGRGHAMLIPRSVLDGLREIESMDLPVERSVPDSP